MQLLLGPAFEIPVIADQLQRRVVPFGARIRKQDVLMTFGQKLGQPVREFGRPGVRGFEEVIVIGKRVERVATGAGEFLVAVAELNAPQSRHAVDELFAVGIPEINSLGSRYDADAFAIQRFGLRERMNVVRGIERAPIFGSVAGFLRWGLLRAGHWFLELSWQENVERRRMAAPAILSEPIEGRRAWRARRGEKKGEPQRTPRDTKITGVHP